MDLPSIPFPGKTQPLNSKSTRKIAHVSKTTAKEPPISRQKRVFGTARNTNIPIKNVANKSANNPSIGISKKQPNSSKPTTLATKLATNPATYETSKRTSPEKHKPKLKTIGVCFQKQEENVTSVVNPRTPVPLPSLNKSSMIVNTPYHTAEKCSRCRFDKLETASYWLGQIKLAESVGKHFVSAAFFGLAFESKAEVCCPLETSALNLKRYLALHGYLSTQNEWRDVSLIYELLKEEDSAEGIVSGNEEACTSNNNNSIACDLDAEQKVLQEQHSLESPEIKSN